MLYNLRRLTSAASTSLSDRYHDGLPQVNHDNKLSLDNNLLVLGFGGVRFEADICLVACGAVVIPKSVRDHK